MAKKKKCPECPAGEKWAVPYADFLSLLLALFIALWAISESDAAKANEVKEAFIQIFDFPRAESPTKKKDAERSGQSERTAQNNSRMIQDSKQENKNNERYNVALDQAENQVAIDLPTSVRFDKLSSDITTEETKIFLRTVSMIISKLPSSVDVEVRGYADDNADYVENYRLSAARSFTVLNHLIANGSDPRQMQFSAYANNFSGFRSEKDLQIAKIYFRIDRDDIKTQKSVLDLIGAVAPANEPAQDITPNIAPNLAPGAPDVVGNITAN